MVWVLTMCFYIENIFSIWYPPLISLTLSYHDLTIWVSVKSYNYYLRILAILFLACYIMFTQMGTGTSLVSKIMVTWVDIQIFIICWYIVVTMVNECHKAILCYDWFVCWCEHGISCGLPAAMQTGQQSIIASYHSNVLQWHGSSGYILGLVVASSMP